MGFGSGGSGDARAHPDAGKQHLAALETSQPSPSPFPGARTARSPSRRLSPARTWSKDPRNGGAPSSASASPISSCCRSSAPRASCLSLAHLRPPPRAVQSTPPPHVGFNARECRAAQLLYHSSVGRAQPSRSLRIAGSNVHASVVEYKINHRGVKKLPLIVEERSVTLACASGPASPAMQSVDGDLVG